MPRYIILMFHNARPSATKIHTLLELENGVKCSCWRWWGRGVTASVREGSCYAGGNRGHHTGEGGKSSHRSPNATGGWVVGRQAKRGGGHRVEEVSQEEGRGVATPWSHSRRRCQS
jgi:hypothetical protein